MLSCGNTRRGARLVRPEDIAAAAAAADESGAASLGVLCSDSLKRVDENGMITEDIDRTLAYRVQTPQVFVREQIIAAHELAAEGFMATDDCGVARMRVSGSGWWTRRAIILRLQHRTTSSWRGLCSAAKRDRY